MLDLRDQFVHPPSPAVELRAFTHGLMPATVPALMQGFCEDWAARGVDAWNAVPDRWDVGAAGWDTVGWWTLPEALGDRWIAPLLGAPRGTCVIQPHVHGAVSMLLSCDEPFAGGRDEIVLSDAEFPSVRHAVRRWAGLRGLRVAEVPAAPGGFVDVDALAAAATDRTAWVFVSHVGFATGEVLPDDALRRLARAAHAVGATFGVDGYHATANVPIDVLAIEADVYVGGLLKEACGSAGNAYFYVREGLDLRPALAGWFADAEPFAFGAEPQDHPTVRRRFLGGTISVATHYHSVEGLRVLMNAADTPDGDGAATPEGDGTVSAGRTGIAAVRADTLAKGARAVERLEAAGLRLVSPRDRARRGAMLVFEADGADRLAAWLKAEHVFTDSRRGRLLRLAPFVWNTAADVDRAADAVAYALATGAHLAYRAPAEGGPVT